MALPEFRARVVRSFQDVQQNFEQLRGLLTGHVLGRRSEWLSGTVAWPGGAAVSTALAVPHTLGATPTHVLVTPLSTTGSGVVSYTVSGLSSTTVTVTLETAGGSSPANTVTTPVSILVAA